MRGDELQIHDRVPHNTQQPKKLRHLKEIDTKFINLKSKKRRRLALMSENITLKKLSEGNWTGKISGFVAIVDLPGAKRGRSRLRDCIDCERRYGAAFVEPIFGKFNPNVVVFLVLKGLKLQTLLWSCNGFSCILRINSGQHLFGTSCISTIDLLTTSWSTHFLC